MLQQLLLGFALEAEGAVLRVREARAPRRRGQLLEVGFLNGVAAGIHSRGGVPGGGGEVGAIWMLLFTELLLNLSYPPGERAQEVRDSAR